MGFHDAGEASILSVYLAGTATPNKFLALINQQFTVSASTDTFTTPINHGLAVNDAVIIAPLQTTANPPAPAAAGASVGSLTNGNIYYVKTVPTATTFTVSATTSGGTPGALFDVTVDAAGGYMIETRGTMTSVNESGTAGTGGYARQSVAAGDWTDAGLVGGDDQYVAATKTFGPATSASLTFTHTAICTTATGAGVLLCTIPSAAISTFAPSQSFQVTTKITMS